MGTKFTLSAADAAGRGIGNAIKAFALAPQMRQQAEMEAGKMLASTDMARAHADKYGEEAAGLRMTNDARRQPIDPSLAPYLQGMARLFQMTGDTNAERLASAGTQVQTQGIRDQALGAVDDLDRMNRLNTLAKPGETYEPFKAVQDTGATMNAATGAMSISNEGLYQLFTGESRAKQSRDNAAAGASSATAQLRRTQTSAVGQGGGKAPAGYRWTTDAETDEPKLEPIPGGPADKSGAPAKPPTEGQAKALMFGSRMAIADEILNELDGKGQRLPNLVKQGVEQVPLIGGGLGMVANMRTSEGEQQVEQAQRDFINAVLRRESGAAIGRDEFTNAQRQYFAQPGDSPQVLAQKRANRRTAIEGMRAEFGDGLNPRFVSTIRDARATRQASQKPAAKPQGDAIPTVSTDDDYARLPSGSQFRDPQGNLRRKQ